MQRCQEEVSVPLELGLETQSKACLECVGLCTASKEICACGGLEQLQLGLLQARKEGRAGSAWLELYRGYSKRSEQKCHQQGPFTD